LPIFKGCTLFNPLCWWNSLPSLFKRNVYWNSPTRSYY